MVEDPEEEQPLSLILATLSSQPLATATPSLIILDTILGIVLFCLRKKLILIVLTFQVMVRTGQSFTKVHFKADPPQSNVTYKIIYP